MAIVFTSDALVQHKTHPFIYSDALLVTLVEEKRTRDETDPQFDDHKLFRLIGRLTDDERHMYFALLVTHSDRKTPSLP